MTRKRLLKLLCLVAICLAILLFFRSSDQTALPKETRPLVFYSTDAQDDLEKTYLEAIGSARESITFLIYALTDEAVIHSLREKSEQGCRVTLIVDPKASAPSERLGKKVKCIKYPTEGLMHLKTLSIDGKLAMVGSANMTFDSLRMHHNLVLGFMNEPLAQTIDHLAQELLEQTPPQPIALPLSHSGQQLEFYPTHKESSSLSKIFEAIASAKESIHIAMFTWTRTDLVDALIDAKARGVKVEVVMDRRQGQGSNKGVVKKLACAGIPVRMNLGNKLMHHKFALIDKKRLIAGSANWTQAAFEKNEDYFLTLYPLTQEQIAFMEKVWNTLILESKI